MVEVNPLKVVFTVSEGGTVVGKTKEQIESFYEIKVRAIVNGNSDGSIARDNPAKNRIVQPGDALEVEGKPEKVLPLIQQSTGK
ncbi:hypothetical protein HY989_01900 [Candidatus Micrarchaeota archaeon]|nr:hypothetical protein [Candidatus Micrarchaeota archaeon]